MSELAHQSASRESHESTAAPLLPWTEGPHDVQRTIENLWSPIDFWHHHRELQSGAHSASQSAPRMFEMAEHADVFSKIGRGVGGLGALGGTLELADGINGLLHGEIQQGALDSAAGLDGILVGVAEAFGATCPPIALANAALGALSHGNRVGQEMGAFGQDETGKHRTAFDWAGHNTAKTYHVVKDAVGGGALGTLIGGVAAGTAGIDYGLAAGVADIGLGISGAAYGAGEFVSGLWR